MESKNSRSKTVGLNYIPNNSVRTESKPSSRTESKPPSTRKGILKTSKSNTSLRTESNSSSTRKGILKTSKPNTQSSTGRRRRKPAIQHTQNWETFEPKTSSSKIQFVNNTSYPSGKMFFYNNGNNNISGKNTSSTKMSSGPISNFTFFEKMNKGEIVRNKSYKANLQENLKTEIVCAGIKRKQYLYRHNSTNKLHFSSKLLNNDCDTYIGEKKDLILNKKNKSTFLIKIKSNEPLKLQNRSLFFNVDGDRKFSFHLQYSGNHRYYSSLINGVEYVIFEDEGKKDKYNLYMVYNDCLLQVNTIYV